MSWSETRQKLLGNDTAPTSTATTPEKTSSSGWAATRQKLIEQDKPKEREKPVENKQTQLMGVLSGTGKAPVTSPIGNLKSGVTLGKSQQTLTPKSNYKPMITDNVIQTEPYSTGIENLGYKLGKTIGNKDPNTTLGAVGYGLAKGVQGVASAVEGISDFAYGGGSTALGWLTSLGGLAPNEFSQGFYDNADKVYKTNVAGAIGQGIADKAETEIAKPIKFAGDVYNVAGNMLTDMGAGKAVSGATKLASDIASKLAIGASAGGGAAQQASQEGADTKQATLYGLSSGLLEASIESISGGIPGLGKGVIDAITKKAPGILPAVFDVLGEGAEEVLSDFITPYIQRIVYNPDAKNATLEEMATDFAMGAGMSGLMQGAGAIGNINTQQTTKKITDVTPATKPVDNLATIAPNIGTKVNTPTQNATQAPTIAPDLQRVVSPVSTENATQGNVVADAVKNSGDAETHIDNRTMNSVKARKTNSFQYDHPELHQYFEYSADLLSMEVENQMANDFMRPAAKKGSATEARVGSRYKAKGAVKTLMDAGLTKPQILQSLQDIKNDHGSENYAAAKRVELVLDDMMTNGYAAYTGDFVPAIDEYVKAKQSIEGAKTNEQRQAEYDEAVDFIEGTPSTSLFPENSLGAKITTPKSNATAESSVGAATGGFVPQTPYSAWSENTENGQFHDVGENAVRSVDLPKINLQGESTMKTAATVMESQNTPDARVAEIQSAMVDGKMAYVPIENKSVAEKASAKIERDGWQTALNDWTSNVRSGKVSPDLVAEGATLLNNAGNAADVTKESYINLLTDYANLVHASGQALQAARILKTLSPEARLYAMQRSVQSMVEEYSAKSKSPVEIKINADLAEKYRKATTDEERDAIVSEIQQDIADQVPSSGLDKWTALRYVNMLGNFKTQARNVAGNATMMGVTKLKNEVAAGLEHAVSAVSGGKFERTKSFVVSKDMYSAAYADFKNVQKAALGEGKYNESNSTNEFERGINEKRTIFKVNGEWGTKDGSSAIAKGARSVTDVGMKVLEGYRKITNQAMEVGDVVFSRITYADALAGYLKAHNVTAEQVRNGEVDIALMDKARLYAIQEAQEATFRDTNAFSKAVSTFDSNWGKGGKIISKGILPFRKTPANIAVRAEEYSPLGVINTAVKAVQKAKGNENVSGADVINSLSKTLTGSGILMLGWTLREMGLLFGKDDDENQSAFNSLTGRQNYSITLPNGTSFTVDWLTPVSMPLFVGANLYDLAAENGLKANDIESVITSITDPIIKMSMMAGVNDALSNIKYSDNNLMQFTLSSAASYLTQGLTNTMLGQIERTSEKVRMSTYTDPTSLVPDWIQRIGGKASAKTPGVDYNQGEYVDAWGRTQNTGTIASKVASNFFNPAYTSTINETALDKELQRLYDATGESSVVPKRVTDKSFKTYDGEYAMAPSEQVKFQKTRGQYAYKELGTLTKSADYKAMSDSEKVKAVSDVYSDATANAKQTIVEARGKMYIPNETVAEKIESYASAGITQKQAYSLNKAIDALDVDKSTNEGKHSVVKTIGQQGYTDKQAIALVGTLYTTHDEDGNVSKSSLLPYLNTSKHLVSLYLTNKDSEMVSMTIPASFSSKSIEYELTDKEKELFKTTYAAYFNSRATNITSADAIKKLRDKAYDAAKTAVIKSR